MAKKYDDEDGVWRTIGGRRIFIKNGQDLASAMKESGKFKSASKGTAKKEMTEEEKEKAKGDKINETMDKRSEIIDKLDKETAELDNYDRYNLAVSKLENTEGMRPTERQYWAGIKERYEKSQKANSDREELRNTEKEYGELSKKMQADDYYYKPEDDRKLKELRAKADSERARQGIDTQEKYDKLMSEDSSKKENEEFKPELGKKLSSRSGQESISKDTKVMRYGDDYIVLKNGANKGEFKSQSAAENFAQVIASGEKFEVSELKNKAQGILPSGDIDTHEGDLYIKKTKTSEALIDNMKDKDSGLLSTFRDQETGETWYDIPFANMGDDYKEKYKHAFPFHEKTEKEKKYAEEVAEYYKDKDIKQEIAKAKKEDSNGIDLNKFNDNAKASFGKIDYYGNGRKSNEVEIEMQLKDGVFTASGSIKNARGTDSVSVGQNIDEIADLMKDNKDVQEIHSLWKKYHLNQTHAGTEKQEEALEKFKGERKAIAEQMNKGKQYDWEKVDERDYEVTKKLLENHNLLKDNGYEYGTGWLKREIPDDDKRRIISLINKYNGKGADSTSGENSNKTTNQSMNDTLRNAFNDYRKKHKNSNMSFTEFMRINKK